MSEYWPPPEEAAAERKRISRWRPLGFVGVALTVAALLWMLWTVIERAT